MAIPKFLLRKLYRQGSLRQGGPGSFHFTLYNVLADANIVAPPRIVVNGVPHAPGDITIDGLDVEAVSVDHPFLFAKGNEVVVKLKGHVLRGGNRIQVVVQTAEFGKLEIFVEDREQKDHCDLPGES